MGDAPAAGRELWETAWRDEPYVERGGTELLACVYEPVGAGAPATDRVAVVEVHGGAWCDHDRRAGRLYNGRLAAAGNVVVAVDFRMGPDHRHPAATEDVTAAVAWVRAEAARLGVDPDRVALAGSSSGGHLALHAALHLDRPVIGVAPLWPPTHPHDRYRYAVALDDDHGRRLVANTVAYFGDETAMLDAAVARVVSAGEHTNLPPVWLVHPTEDRNVPRHITEDLVTAYRAARGEIDVWWVEGQPHAFGHQPGDATDELVTRLLSVLDDWSTP